MVETLKDYAIKALVNTVDHLGSVTYKVNDLLEEKVDEVSGTDLRVSCIEQVSLDCFYNQLDIFKKPCIDICGRGAHQQSLR